MNTERWVRVIAGFFVLANVMLSAPFSPIFVSEWFLAFTLFVGFNLLQSGFTSICPLDRILLKLGVPGSGGCGR